MLVEEFLKSVPLIKEAMEAEALKRLEIHRRVATDKTNTIPDEEIVKLFRTGVELQELVVSIDDCLIQLQNGQPGTDAQMDKEALSKGIEQAIAEPEVLREKPKREYTRRKLVTPSPLETPKRRGRPPKPRTIKTEAKKRGRPTKAEVLARGNNGNTKRDRKTK